MGRVQPNFSWQKYEQGKEDATEQFQYQLQHQYVVIANGINGTVRDLSYYLTERVTDFTWVNGQPVWTLTVATVAWEAVGTTNTIPLNIEPVPTKKNPLINYPLVIISMIGTINNGDAFSNTTLPLPNLDVTTAANSIQIQENDGDIILTSGGTDYSAYSGYITIYYTKT
jgi:hypothetical protein